MAFADGIKGAIFSVVNLYVVTSAAIRSLTVGSDECKTCYDEFLQNPDVQTPRSKLGSRAWEVAVGQLKDRNQTASDTEAKP